MRKVFNLPTSWIFEVSLMTGGVLYALGWAYAHLLDSHVRVDILYTRLSPRGKAVVDTICSLVFFLPIIILLTKTSFDYTVYSWVVRERSVETGWYPTITPYRAMVFLGFLLLALQGVAKFIRDFYLMVKGESL
jgi:TRAP-type mannitol/chloroaromatic compound transport system permease small subunit